MEPRNGKRKRPILGTPLRQQEGENSLEVQRQRVLAVITSKGLDFSALKHPSCIFLIQTYKKDKKKTKKQQLENMINN